MLKSKLSVICLLLVFLISACERKNSGQEKITIATAANMQYAMLAITKKFEEKTGIHCDLIINSSGKLTAQIKAGAPYDIFVAANMKYPISLYDERLTTASPVVYAYGKLVLWSAEADTTPTIENLNTDNVNHIAIANPESAPYGVASMQCLDYYKLRSKVESKLVFGESIAQTNLYIMSGSAEYGFTAKSVVLAPEIKDQGKWIEIAPEAYSKIAQGMAIIKRESVKPAAESFYNYMLSHEAKKLLEEYGYGIN